jgi:hypothetical protein
MGHAAGLADFVMGGFRRVIGILAAMLPSRWWPWLDFYVPTTSSAIPASILTLLTGMAIGIPGFLSYAEEAASAVNAVAWETAKQNPDTENVGALLRGAPSAFSALSLVLFLFTTPTGWLTMYLGGSGLLRAVSAAIEGGFGDPLLTAVDAIAMGTRRRTMTTLQRVRREALEGPEMPDRLMGAAQLDITDAELVIVASRPKPDWNKGTVVLTGDGKAYRVGVIEQRTIAGALRTLYPLTEHKDLEAFRRVVHYELPPGRRH